MKFLSFRKLLFFSLGCTSSLTLLNFMTLPPALSQVPSSVKAGTYSLYCESNTPSKRTLYNYGVEGLSGVSFFSKYVLFVLSNNTVVEDYAPFFYPSNLVTGAKRSPEAKSISSKLVGVFPTISYPSGSKTPHLRIAFINLSNTTCTPPTMTEKPESSPLEIFPGGAGYQARVSAGQSLTLPDGTTLEADSKLKSAVIKQTNGVKAQYFFDEDGVLKSIQLFDSNGKALVPGETVTLPDGTTITQNQL
jgi:hypothetical protein